MSFRKDKIVSQIKSIIALLEKNGIKISDAYLFGSYARGKANEWSDIDVALVSNDFSGIRFHDIERLISITKKCNSFIEFHPFRKEAFDSQRDLFVKEIISTGIKLK